jgi:hypothetical protein
MRIVSLTAIPSRFPEMGPTLESLVAQDAGIDRIELNIPLTYRRFADWDGALPKVPAGVEIVRVDEDLGPATKVLWTAARYADQPETQILFCDDDRFYGPGWAERLFSEQAARPDHAVALSGWQIERAGLAPTQARPEPRFALKNRKWDWEYRRRRLAQQWKLKTLKPTRRKPPRVLIETPGYADVFEGFGGVCVRPSFFQREDFTIPDLLWTVDDVWLSGMLARRGIRIWVPEGLYSPQTTNADDQDALWRWEIDGMGNPEINAKCAAYLNQTYGVWA